jgi:hypothetical protein
MVAEQFVVRRRRSTENTAYKLTGHFIYLNRKRQIGVIFCDLAKAFDCVMNHEILLAELHFCGIEVTGANSFRW